MTPNEMKSWLIEQVSAESGLKPEQISCDQPFSEFSLDSLSLTSLSFELESKLELDEISPSIFTEYDTINKLVAWIEDQG
jgi:acyl carrier protein